MPEIVASLVAKLSADVTELQRGLATARRDLDTTAKHSDTTTRNMGANISRNLSQAGAALSSLGQRLTIGVTLPIIGVGVAFAKLAIDAFESEDLFDRALGKMGAEARAWSDQISTSLKLNAYQVRQQLGVWDMMIKSFGMGEQAALDMSKGLTVLAQDMASAYNIPVEDAFVRLQSAMAGQTEPMMRFGVNLLDENVKIWAVTHGLVKQGEELSAQGKVLARYGLILESTSLAQGNLAATIESPANRLRALQAQAEQAGIAIGTKLLPTIVTAMEGASAVITEVQNRWTEMGDEAQNQILATAALLVAGGPLMSGLGVGIQGVGLLISAFALLPSRVKVAVLGAVAAMIPLRDFMADQFEIFGKMEDYRVGFNGGQQWRDWAANLRKPIGDIAGDVLAIGTDAAIEALLAKAAGLKGGIEQAISNANSAKGRTQGVWYGSRENEEMPLPKVDPYEEFLANLLKYTAGINTAAADTTNAGSAIKSALTSAADAAKQKFDDLKSSIDDAKTALQNLLSTPLKGEKAFSDAQFGIQQQVATLQLRIDDIKLGGKATPAKQRQITQLEKQIDTLRLKSDKLTQEASLAFDAQKRQLDEMANPAVEATYAELVKGISEQRSQMDLLTPRVNAAEEAYRALERAIRDAANAPVPQIGAVVGSTATPSATTTPSSAPAPAPATGNWTPPQVNWLAGGGWLNEPVLGTGLRSGAGYMLAERGPEYVGKGGGGGNVFNILPGAKFSVRNDGDIKAIAWEVMDIARRQWRDATAQSTRWPLGLSEV